MFSFGPYLEKFRRYFLKKNPIVPIGISKVSPIKVLTIPVVATMVMFFLSKNQTFWNGFQIIIKQLILLRTLNHNRIDGNKATGEKD